MSRNWTQPNIAVAKWIDSVVAMAFNCHRVYPTSSVQQRWSMYASKVVWCPSVIFDQWPRQEHWWSGPGGL